MKLRVVGRSKGLTASLLVGEDYATVRLDDHSNLEFWAEVILDEQDLREALALIEDSSDDGPRAGRNSHG